jgi:hypothetical protein
VLAVEAQDGGLVLGAGGEADRLVLADDAPGFPWLLGEQRLAVADPADHAGRAAAQDQALQRRPAVQDVLHGQHPAPGTAEEVQAVKFKSRTDLREFLHEAFHVPQGDVGRAVRTAAAQLVVEEDPAAFGQDLERLEVVVGEAGAAVQAEQRCGVRVVADGAVPDLAAGHVDVALFALHAAMSSLSPPSFPHHR